MTGELHAVHTLPDTYAIGCFHPDQHGGEGIVNEADYCTWTAARMGFAVSCDAFGSFNSNNDGVAFSGAANPHRDGFAFG